jgi:hypothetical protein
MAERQKSATKPEPAPSERDELVKIDLDPEVALRALLKVDPDAPTVEADNKAPRKRPSGS